MKWKVCGMREAQNIEDLIELGPDFLGIILYPPSKRYVDALPPQTVSLLQASSTKTVGVFVNEEIETIIEKVSAFGLDYVQLHGDESVDHGRQLLEQGIRLIKVFRIAGELPVDDMKSWEALADYFLFDTKTDLYGGSGRQFDWELLRGYDGTTPYLLSGGIGPKDLDEVFGLDLHGLEGIDVNSGFELAPGLKDISKIREMKEVIC